MFEEVVLGGSVRRGVGGVGCGVWVWGVGIYMSCYCMLERC